MFRVSFRSRVEIKSCIKVLGGLEGLRRGARFGQGKNALSSNKRFWFVCQKRNKRKKI